MSLSAEVANESPDVPAPPLAPALSENDSPPDYYTSKFVFNNQQNTTVAAGRLPEEVYASTLPRWRAALRRQCLMVVEWESEVIAQWQVRSPFLLSNLGLE